MAKIEYNVCDRCGKLLEKTYFKGIVKVVNKFCVSLTFHKFEFGARYFNYEFCDDCGEVIHAFIRAKPTEERNEIAQE